jgi:nucleoside phosphorylase
VNGSVPGIAVRRNPSAGTQPKARADVVILTATPVESDALERVMVAAGHDRQRLAYGPVNTYSLYGPIGETVVAHVRCTMGSGGTAAAGLTVRDAIGDLQPWAVLAVGIAFGIKDAEQPIGQLLLSESLSAYELQRIGDSSAGQVVISRGSTMSGSPTLLGRFRDSHLNELGIDVLAGEILSGEKLVDNAAFKAALVERYPNAVGGEMEGAGVVAASHRAAVEWLVVKAVCDYAHSKGDDKQSRQWLAADTAARALLEVLTKGALMRR